jgi:hypothetical protein
MSDGLNEGVVGDTAKLMMHRLIARKLRRDLSLVEQAKLAKCPSSPPVRRLALRARVAVLLALPVSQLASRLISRDREMARLRNSSPFFLAQDVHFGDYDTRIRLRRAARRIVERGLTLQTKSPP